MPPDDVHFDCGRQAREKARFRLSAEGSVEVHKLASCSDRQRRQQTSALPAAHLLVLV